MSVGTVYSGLGFCCLDEAVDALEDSICDAGVEPPQYACFMPLDGSGGLDDGRKAGVRSPEIPFLQEGFGHFGRPQFVEFLECQTSLVSKCGFQISAAHLAEIVVYPAAPYTLQTKRSPIICIISCRNDVRVEFIQPSDIRFVSGRVHVTQHLGLGGETLAPFPVRQNSFQCEIAIDMTFRIQAPSRLSHACRPDRGERPPITSSS